MSNNKSDKLFYNGCFNGVIFNNPSKHLTYYELHAATANILSLSVDNKIHRELFAKTYIALYRKKLSDNCNNFIHYLAINYYYIQHIAATDGWMVIVRKLMDSMSNEHEHIIQEWLQSYDSLSVCEFIGM